MNDVNIEITKGSRYSVRFGKDDEAVGVFKGYSMIGSETALVIDSGDTVRYIMAGHVLSLTLLEAGAPVTKRKNDDPDLYYG